MNPSFQKFHTAAIEILRRYAWFPLAIFFAHELCAHGIDAYRRWPAIDIPLHFFGGLAIACFLAGALRVFEERHLLRPSDAWVRIALLFGLVNTAAVCWEFAEWIADHALGTHCQLGLGDTLLDLLMGMLGGLAYLIPALVRAFSAKSPPDAKL
jgi:hypothetical protein